MVLLDHVVPGLSSGGFWNQIFSLAGSAKGGFGTDCTVQSISTAENFPSRQMCLIYCLQSVEECTSDMHTKCNKLLRHKNNNTCHWVIDMEKYSLYWINIVDNVLCCDFLLFHWLWLHQSEWVGSESQHSWASHNSLYFSSLTSVYYLVKCIITGRQN